MSEFPIFAAHDDASCFNCGGDWRGSAWPMHSGNAPGRGFFFQSCDKCGHRTFYDLTEESSDETAVSHA